MTFSTSNIHRFAAPPPPAFTYSIVMASKDSQLEKPSGDPLELPAAVIAQAEAAASNTTQRKGSTSFGSVPPEGNSRPNENLADQQYVQRESCHLEVEFSSCIL